MAAQAAARALAALGGMALPLLGAVADQPGHGTRVAQCEPRAKMVDYVRSALSAVRVARGQTFEGELLEVFVAKTGDWTILITDPSGRACIATHGGDWRRLRQPQVAQTPSS